MRAALYLNLVVALAAALAGAQDDGTTTADTSPLAGRIDELLAAAFPEGAVPEPPCDDATFLRRAHLDATGVIPSGEAVEAFLRDRAPDRRARVVDELLASPLHAAFQAMRWTRMLVGYDARLPVLRRDALLEWLRGRFEENRPYDEVVRDLITATGTNTENGAVNFLLRYAQSRREAAGAMARAFLGLRIHCAQCHDHPYEKWRQADYDGMLAFFARVGVRRVGEGEDMRPVVEVFERPRGQLTVGGEEDPGRERAVVFPRYLTGEGVETGPGPHHEDRRALFARLTTDPANPWFARATVNRVWAHYMGRGLVEPVDDMGESSVPSHPALLEALAVDLAAHRYDLRRLERGILLSAAYQRATASEGPNAEDRDRYLRRYVTPLGPEQLFYSVLAATGLEDVFRARRPKRIEQMKNGYLARLVVTFGDDMMDEILQFEGTVPQALEMLNGTLVNEGARVRPESTLGRLLQEGGRKDMDLAAQRVYLAALGRLPTEAERRRSVLFVREAASPREGFEDLLWALLNSSEFIFNH
ncbi:MAG: DUF1549 domain-containing protein [Planctomycetes bacterium]|nr:DUF1549 domain-containing protein [Planctomycetota bacterium]